MMPKMDTTLEVNTHHADVWYNGFGHPYGPGEQRTFLFTWTASSRCGRNVHFILNNYFTKMCSGSEEGSYLRLIDFCITEL